MTLKKRIIKAALWTLVIGGSLLAILTRILGVAYVGYFAAVMGIVGIVDLKEAE